MKQPCLNVQLFVGHYTSSSLEVYRNGLLLSAGVDYSLSGAVITFITVVPQPTDTLLCSFRISQ